MAKPELQRELTPDEQEAATLAQGQRAVGRFLRALNQACAEAININTRTLPHEAVDGWVTIADSFVEHLAAVEVWRTRHGF
jgi:formaldehyde-activating enzyme involved in methanogenesis